MTKLQQARRKAQKGFTLIELMIVVAIIGILAAVAIPQYRDYTTKSRWAANVASVSGIQQAVAQCLQENAGKIAVCGTMAQLVTAGNLRSATPPTIPGGKGNKGTDAFSLADGVITLTGSEGAGGCTVTLTPVGADAETTNSLEWTIKVTKEDGCTKQSTGFIEG